VSDIPDGFRAITLPGGFFDEHGPIYTRLEGSVPVTGFRVMQRHINPFGVCQGGVMASFADMQALSAMHLAGITDRYTPTVNLTLDFIAPATLGMWVELRTELMRATRSLLFSRGLISADGTLIVRASGIFKVGRAAHAGRKDEAPAFL